jgi:hypothetical protein
MRWSEGALLEPFVPDGESVTIKIEELDHIPSAIAENKERAGERIGSKLGPDQSAQSIKGLSHVAGAMVKIDAGGCGHGKHGFLVPIASTTVRRVMGSKPRSISMWSSLPRETRIPLLCDCGEQEIS